jgi:hypothetical protein
MLSFLLGLTAMAQITVSSDAPFETQWIVDRVNKDKCTNSEAVQVAAILISGEYDASGRSVNQVLKLAERKHDVNYFNQISSKDIRKLAVACAKSNYKTYFLDRHIQLLNDDDAPIVAKAMADAGRTTEAERCLSLVKENKPKALPYLAATYEILGRKNEANNLYEQIVSKNTDPGKCDTDGKFIVVNYLISKDKTTPLNKSENKLLSKYLENIAKKPNDLSIEQSLAVLNAIEAHPYNKSTETEQKVLNNIKERQLNFDEIIHLAQYFKSKNDVANVDYYMNKAESIFSKYPTFTTLFYNLINAYQSIYGDDKTVEMVARFYPKYAKSKYKDEKNLQIGRDMQQILIKGGRTDVVVKQFEESLDKQTITGAALVDNYVSIKMLNNSSDDVNRVANKLKDRIVSSGESKNAVGEIINALYKSRESLGNEADEILASIKFNNQKQCDDALAILLDRGYKDAFAWSYPILIQDIDSIQDEDLLKRIIVATGVGSFVVGDFQYQNLGKTVSAEYIGNSSTVTFPTEVTYNNHKYAVSSIKGVSNKDNLVSVVIPNGIEKISENAFDGCEKLTTVTFPASKIQIGKLAFANCPALTTMTNLNFTKDIDDPEQSLRSFVKICFKSIKMLDTIYKQLIAKYSQDQLYKFANYLMDGYLEGESFKIIPAEVC